MTASTTTSRIYVAGHAGLVGSAIVRRLNQTGYRHVLTATRDQVDLRDQAAVNYWFKANRPEYVYLVAGPVGGIMANSARPAEFIYDNMMIHATVVHAAHQFAAKRLLYLGSSCIYPRLAPQPMTEDMLLTGALEPTNEAYAIAKIAGIKLCQAYRAQYGCDFISAMPTNLYGPGDNFDLTSSHVLPALMRKFHEAKIRGDRTVTLWGTGAPRREFLHVDDLAEMVRAIVYPEAELAWDSSKPDGMPRKLLDVSRLHALGWTHRVELAEGIASTYRWFLEHEAGKPATVAAVSSARA